MRFDILTLFPGMFAGPLTESILKRAAQAGTIEIALHDIRAYATDRHRTADDTPYGGGAGMVMKAAPLAAAIRDVLKNQEPRTENQSGDRQVLGSPVLGSAQVILMSPAGELFNQRIAHELAGCERLVLVCGHYEGIDERVREALIDRELSIGDYVLTGGELAAMVVVDAVARLVPGVIAAESIGEESHGAGLLEYPHYTRPALWEGRAVPEVLLSGHHGQVAQWRRRQQLARTLARRPELLRQAQLTREDLNYLRSLGWPPTQTNELA